MKALHLIVLLGILIASIASGDDAANPDDLGAPVTFGWFEASGPVWEYAVFVDRGEGFPGTPSQIVPNRSVTIVGAVGTTILVRVAARDDIGNQGPFSLDSDPWTFVAVVEPLGAPGQPMVKQP